MLNNQLTQAAKDFSLSSSKGHGSIAFSAQSLGTSDMPPVWYYTQPLAMSVTTEGVCPKLILATSLAPLSCEHCPSTPLSFLSCASRLEVSLTCCLTGVRGK